MINLLNIKRDIVQVSFYLNIILLAIGIFISSKTYFIIAIILNLILNGTLMMINKWSDKFMTQFTKLLRGRLNG